MLHMQIGLLNKTTWVFGHLLVATFEYVPHANMHVKWDYLDIWAPFGSLLNMIHMQICLLSETTFMFGHLLVAAFEYVTVYVEVGLHDYEGNFEATYE